MTLSDYRERKQLPHMLPVGKIGNFPVCCWDDPTPPASMPDEFLDFLNHSILWGVVCECVYSSDPEKLGFYIQVLCIDNNIDERRVYPEKRLIKVRKYQEYHLDFF